VALPFGVNPDLPGNRHTLPRDYVFVNPSGGAVDTDGHGTHVSGTVGEATNNALQVAGMAYNVKIMPVKVCASYWDIMFERAQAGTPGFIPTDSGGCLSTDQADGVRYAVDNGARVMNISIGGTSQSATMQSALAYAASKGAFIAIAMGNDFEDGNPTIYPAAFAPGIAGVMSVASIGPSQVKAYYSSTGSYCEISAPGGDVRAGSGRQDLGRIWQSSYIPTDVDPDVVTIPRFDRYATVGIQGTSMAAPHVAGLAALLMSQVPGLTGAQVEGIIKASARNLGDANSYGAGLIQPRAALFGLGIRK
jgi:serine protease